MMRVTLYTRQECKLCDQAKADLEALQNEIPHTLVEIDIESDQALLNYYREKIPVVVVGPYTLQAPITRLDLKVALSAAREGQAGAEPRKEKPDSWAIRVNRVVLGFARHWLAIFNLLIFLYAGLPFVAPTLMKAGAVTPAKWIYTIYSPMCHQLGFRSWYLFGEQAAYPTEDARTKLIPFGEATGLSEHDYLAARRFVGDERLGYKVALCERDVAIYGGILLAGLAFIGLRKRLKPLPIGLWILLGIVPIALDGGLQMVTSLDLPLLSFLPQWESTPLLRTITGGLFGVMNVWLAYPYVEETMLETQVLLAAKLAGVKARSSAVSSAD